MDHSLRNSDIPYLLDYMLHMGRVAHAARRLWTSRPVHSRSRRGKDFSSLLHVQIGPGAYSASSKMINEALLVKMAVYRAMKFVIRILKYPILAT